MRGTVENELLGEAIIACIWSHAMHKSYEVTDMDVFERWVRQLRLELGYVRHLCTHTVGDLIDMYPTLEERLKAWATSDNR